MYYHHSTIRMIQISNQIITMVMASSNPPAPRPPIIVRSLQHILLINYKGPSPISKPPLLVKYWNEALDDNLLIRISEPTTLQLRQPTTMTRTLRKIFWIFTSIATMRCLGCLVWWEAQAIYRSICPKAILRRTSRTDWS